MEISVEDCSFWDVVEKRIHPLSLLPFDILSVLLVLEAPVLVQELSHLVPVVRAEIEYLPEDLNVIENLDIELRFSLIQSGLGALTFRCPRK